MKDLPMPKSFRTALEQKLIEIRNTVVADIKLTNDEKLLIKG